MAPLDDIPSIRRMITKLSPPKKPNRKYRPLHNNYSFATLSDKEREFWTVFLCICGVIAVVSLIITGNASEFVGWVWNYISTWDDGGGVRHGDYRWDDPEIGYQDNPFKRN